MEWSLWERARRYRRIAAAVSEDEAVRAGKRVRPGDEKLKVDKQEGPLGKLSAAD